MLANFSGPPPELPPHAESLHLEAKEILRDLRAGDVEIRVKNARALAELRRLEGHARR